MSRLSARLPIPLCFAAALFLATGCPTHDSGGSHDGGSGGSADSGSAQDAGSGTCASDVDCPGGTCDLFTGACVFPDGGTPDAGSVDGGGSDGGKSDGGAVCTPGEARCNADGVTLEVCATDGTQWRSAQCPATSPACFAGACVACAPGTGECQGDLARTCKSDGSGYDTQDCAAAGGTCSAGVCLVCTPNATTCEAPNTLRVCDATGTSYSDTPCGPDTCDAAAGACVPVSCTTGTQTCQGDKLMACNATGNGYDLVEDCSATGGVCRVDHCVNLCADAVANNSYIGCEYWPVVLANGQLAQKFQSDYALVLSNPNAGTTAHVEVFAPGSSTPVATTDIAGGTLDILHLPWNALDAVDASGNPVTSRGAIAYHLVSSVPVTAYQFNPLSSRMPSGCTQDADCPGYNPLGLGGETCEPGPDPRSCSSSDYSYTNDASLLLPAHIFSDTPGGPSTYVALAAPHEWVQIPQLLGNPITAHVPAFVAIVATQDVTQVTVSATGAIAAGAGLAAVDPGGTLTVTLNAGEVLQLASRDFGTPEEFVDGGLLGSGVTFRRYPASDLTGSVITADKPIAVYGGADCYFVPYDKQACDHLEQQIFPFSKWGSSYVAAHSEYPNNTTGDVWRLVAAANGTQVTFTPSSVHAPATLNAGEFIEITTATDFLVESQDIDHPIMVAQFFVGIQTVVTDPTQAMDKTNVGDPSLVLAIPTQQYRDAYTFTTPDTIARDFITVVRPAGATVALDAIPMNVTWAPIGSTGWEVGRMEITDGTHKLTANQPVGLSVYGFDWSVSYGYPGGLDLKSLVVINPGG